MKKTEKRKRRYRSPHPGVRIKSQRRKSGVAWYAVFNDSETRRESWINLDKLGLTNDAARIGWCMKKSRILMLRRADIELGAPLKTVTPVAKGVQDYLEYAEIEGLAPRTIASHRGISKQFLEWCHSCGVRTTEELDQPRLEEFRRYFFARRTMASARGKGAGRGTKRKGEAGRSPSTINNALGRIRSMLNQWRRQGIIPLLNTDLIRDALRFVRARRELPYFLHKPDIRRMLEAAERHDAVTFKLTREEHDGLKPAGSTPRHEPIRPFVIASLLTGCRFNELACLRWDEVDLDAQEVILRASRTKTARARRIPLEITPSLVDLFAVMKRDAMGAPYVFGGESPFTREVADGARKRMMEQFDAPKFNWQDLRRTCGTFLTCAPGIYGGASAFMSAKRLGHSVLVAERHYVGAVSTVTRDAQCLEAAMGIEDILLPARPQFAPSFTLSQLLTPDGGFRYRPGVS